jgi:hypothetical protein
MTSQSPRIYTYKITFGEVPYYYYGVKKEKVFDEEYWGSPVANKWCWELYTPKKQILEIFDYTDEGWLEAQEVEKRLIQPVFNTDKWCLNENCGGKISLKVSREVGLKHKENGTGCFSITPEQRKEASKKGMETNKKNKTGIFGISPEQRSENSRKGVKIVHQIIKDKGIGIYSLTPEEKIEYGAKGGNKAKEFNLGFHNLSQEERQKNGIKGGNKAKEMGFGIFSLSPEQKSENSKKGGNKVKEMGIGIVALTAEQRRELGKNTGNQKWMCLETGYITAPGALSNYQRAKGIDTSKRKRVA